MQVLILSQEGGNLCAGIGNILLNLARSLYRSVPDAFIYGDMGDSLAVENTQFVGVFGLCRTADNFSDCLCNSLCRGWFYCLQ